MLQTGALALIGAYQRYLSPRKGYVCALHAASGGRSCSRYGARAIARTGLWSGAHLVWRRLQVCAAAAQALAEAAREPAIEPTFEDRTFGVCAPAVREARKLCCGSLIGGLSGGGER